MNMDPSNPPLNDNEAKMLINCIQTKISQVACVEINDIFSILKARWVCRGSRTQCNTNESPFANTETNHP